jgi:hypothetical protein
MMIRAFAGTGTPGRNASISFAILGRWRSCSAMYLIDSGRLKMAASAMTIGTTPPI